MSFGLGSPQGSMRWIAELDTRNFKQGTATLKQEFTSLNATTRGLISGVNPLANSFNPLSQNISKTSTAFGALGGNMRAVQTNLDAQGRGLTSTNTLMGGLGSTVETTGSKFGKLGGVLKNNLTSVSVLAGGIAGLDNQFLALHKAQVAAERANVMVAKANNRVEDTQARLNKMVKEGKKGTAEYNALLEDFKLAQDSASVATERATVAQETLAERTEDFWVGILPNALFIAGSSADLLQKLGKEFKSLSGIVPKLTAAFSGFNGVMLGTGAAFGAATVGIGALLIPNLAELADIVADMNQPGADFEALGARIEHFQEKISNTDPISKFLFEISKIKDVATNVSAEIDRINLAKTLDENLIGSLEFKSVEPRVQEMVKSRVDYIKRILLNPNNWVVEKTNIRGQTFIDREATMALVENTSKVLMEGFDDIRTLIYNNIGTMPTEVANALEDGIGVAEPQLTKVVDSMVTLLDTELGKAIISEENRKAIDAWEEAQLRLLDPTALKNLIEGRDLVGKTADIISQTIEFAINEAAVDTATQPLIDKMLADLSGIPAQMTPVLTESFNQVLDTVGGQSEWEKIIGGIRDPKIRDKALQDLRSLGQTVDQGLEEIKANTQEKWDELWSGLREGEHIKTALDIDVDKDKLTNKILDYMPDYIKKDIEFEFESEESLNSAKLSFEEVFAKAADRVSYDDADIDRVVNGYIKFLREKFKDDPNAQAMADDLAALVAGPDTETKVKELISKWEKIGIPTNLSIDNLTFDSDSGLESSALEDYIEGGNNQLNLTAAAIINRIEWGGATPTPTIEGEYKITKVSIPGPGVGVGDLFKGMEWLQGGGLQELIDAATGKKQAEAYRKLKGGGFEMSEDDWEKAGLPEGSGPTPGAGKVIDLIVNNTKALQAVGVVAKNIDALSALKPFVDLQNTAALQVSGVVAKNIFALETIQPQISLKNAVAFKVLSATAKGIMNLEDLKPQIQLKNREAFGVIAATAKEIMDLEDLTPTIHVQVEYDGIQSFQHGGHFITDGPQVIKVGDNPSGKEEVTINPIPHGSRSGPGFGTRNGRGPGGMSAAGYGPGVMEFHVTNVLMDREITRVYRRSMGDNQARFV